MSKEGPIGVFDSGYGGLTILKDILAYMPQYDFIYLGDNARAPYGTRSFDVVYEYTLQAVRELFSRGCHLVILACNTASAKALRTIQQNDLPKIDNHKRVLGVIRPSAEVIGQWSITRHVGILATEGTVRSESYMLELEKFAPNIKVVQHACPLWVPIIESDKQDTEAGKMFIKADIESLLLKDPSIDVIVLGCTHYPIIENYIRSIIPDNIRLVSQGDIVAQKLVEYLQRHPSMDISCSKGGTVQFLTSENTAVFNTNASKFLGIEITSEHIHF